MRNLDAVALVAVAVLLSACARVGGTGTATATPLTDPSPFVQDLPDLPVDPSLTAVSRRNPSPGAIAALDQCVAQEDRDKIVGMAQLPGREVHKFSLTNGHEPELQTDALVWAIQLEGTFPSRVGPDMINPLCVVINGISHMYVPWGRVGEAFAPPADFVAPIAALPSLAP